MPNIKFNYLHRDGGNYKNYGSVVFVNPANLTLAEVKALIRSKLIYDQWFYAHEWDVPQLFFPFHDPIIDPSWHEFEGVEYTDEGAEKDIITGMNLSTGNDSS